MNDGAEFGVSQSTWVRQTVPWIQTLRAILLMVTDLHSVVVDGRLKSMVQVENVRVAWSMEGERHSSTMDIGDVG